MTGTQTGTRTGTRTDTRTGHRTPDPTGPAQWLPDGVVAGPDGSCTVSGPALAWLRHLDRAIVRLAVGWGAEEYDFPPLLPATDLARMGYFAAFPHLVTFPANVADSDAELADFADNCDLDASGAVPVTGLAPVRHALTPAACYPVYPLLGARHLAGPVLVTTVARCFRREQRFVPLRRQWAFTMREVVCAGTPAEVADFLARARAAVDALRARLALPTDWAAATDPFFRPERNAAHLLQRLDPVKQEAMVGSLAVASVNLHHDHFGSAFDIGRAAGPAHTGCVAFGLERWLRVAADRWGPDPRAWPQLSTVEATDG